MAQLLTTTVSGDLSVSGTGTFTGKVYGNGGIQVQGGNLKVDSGSELECYVWAHFEAKTSLLGQTVLGSAVYGSTLPTSGMTVGQVFFKI